MKAINIKMLRDLKELRGQVIAIGLVIIAGISVYVTMASTADSLQRTLHIYYQEYNFAEGFASVRRAPQSLADRLRSIPGINQLDTRVSAQVRVKLSHFDQPVTARIVSIPGGRQPKLNQLVIEKGRLVQEGHPDEVVVSKPFAKAHHLKTGDHLTVIIKGNKKVLTVVGIALSPEFLYQIMPGTIFPNPKLYGVMWMGREALASAYDMDGAFNELSFTLSPAVHIKDVIQRVDLLLDRYGGQGAYPREDQLSHNMISEELKQLANMAFLLPLIFLGVAAFLLNIVVSRLIALQREQIAILKAFGYSNWTVGMHYLKLVLMIAGAGAIIGTLLGVWMGSAMAEMYLQFYHFPYLEYMLNTHVVVTAILLTGGAAVVGALIAIRHALQLPPAEAMRPATPTTYRSTLIERLGLKNIFDQPTRIIFRNLERQWFKSVMTVIGISCSCAILIMGLFWGDAFDRIIHIQFDISQREDMTVTFTQPTSVSAIYKLNSLRAVQYAEPFRSVSVKLIHGHYSYETGIKGIPNDHYLRRVINKNLQPIAIPPKGILLSRQLAQKLNAKQGDKLTVEVMEGQRYTREVAVVDLAKQYLGMGAYMSMAAANRLSGEGRATSGALLMVDQKHKETLIHKLEKMPRVASIVSQQQTIDAFIQTAAKSLLVMAFILTLFAGIIAMGVIHNSVRIALSERDRELASMRVLGFTKGEIAYILLGEMAVLVLLAIPIGLGIGTFLTNLSAQALQTDMYRFPAVLGSDTFALAATIVLVSAVISGFLMYRKLTKLDLIEVLKTRE